MHLAVNSTTRSNRQYAKPALLVTLALLVAVGASMGLLRDLGDHLRSFSEAIGALGWAAGPAFVIIVAGLAAVGVPRLILCSVAGLTFGAVGGLILGHIAVLAGSYAVFLAARAMGPQHILARWPKLDRFLDVASRHGIASVLLVRQLPLPSFHINLLLALTPLSHRHFLIGSLIGFLPEGVPATLIGAGLVAQDTGSMFAYVAVGIVAVVVIVAASGWIRAAMHQGGGSG